MIKIEGVSKTYGNGAPALNNLNLDLITSVLLNYTDNVLQHILLQKESTKELGNKTDISKQHILKVRIALLLSMNHDFC